MLYGVKLLYEYSTLNPLTQEVEDSEINEAYSGAVEIEEGDKANMGVVGVSEASNIDVTEPKSEEKPYTDEDLKKAEELF